jgi:hypothetical protein
LQARIARLKPQAVHARFLHWLSGEFGVDGAALDAEYHSSRFRRSYLARRQSLNDVVGPLRLGTSGGWTLKSLYLLIRAARPRIVVETGVLYGATSAHILAALEANAEGELYSIDLPHDPREPGPEALVPGHLHRRWALVLGDSRRELPPLLKRLGAIDCFYHDSLHTFEHMTWEYQTVLPYLSWRTVFHESFGGTRSLPSATGPGCGGRHSRTVGSQDGGVAVPGVTWDRSEASRGQQAPVP